MKELPHTSLAIRLRERIQREGPITFRDWMEAALYDSSDGYYTRRDLTRWGRSGDYRTAPERSPLFATTFARYFASLYSDLGSPREWRIFEAGAGAGHFARGVLESFRQTYPQIFSATKYVIDEANAAGREVVPELLDNFVDRVEFAQINDDNQRGGVGIVFANELLDAFAVHRVKARDGKLLEFFVDVDIDGRFRWTEREPSTPQLKFYLERAGVELADGQIAEINLQVEEWMTQAAALFERGYMVLVDYGAEAAELYGAAHRSDGSLRAFHRHQIVEDLFENPGEQDLTTTIDWTNVKRIGTRLGLHDVSFDRQDEFLLSVGLLDELERMAAETESDAEAVVLRSSVRELILPGGMGESFQVLVQRIGD